MQFKKKIVSGCLLQSVIGNQINYLKQYRKTFAEYDLSY